MCNDCRTGLKPNKLLRVLNYYNIYFFLILNLIKFCVVFSKFRFNMNKIFAVCTILLVIAIADLPSGF